ncbi:unnamed protein product, partial [Laminaria digitata]
GVLVSDRQSGRLQHPPSHDSVAESMAASLPPPDTAGEKRGQTSASSYLGQFLARTQDPTNATSDDGSGDSIGAANNRLQKASAAGSLPKYGGGQRQAVDRQSVKVGGGDPVARFGLVPKPRSPPRRPNPQPSPPPT